MSLVIVVGAVIFSGSILDRSFDGNAYHKLAVGLLANGWVPSEIAIPAGGFSPVDIPGFDRQFRWVRHYCKAPWFFAAGIYRLTGNIETGKAYTLVAMAAVALLGVGVASKRHPPLKVAGLLLALNPVALYQWATFYIDGFLQLMLAALVLGLAECWLGEGGPDKAVGRMVVTASMFVLGNIKFTGLVYGGLFCMAYFALVVVRSAREHAPASARRELICLCCLAAATVLVGGAQTYLPNLMEKGNPFWPLAGEGAVDIMTDSTPQQFVSQGRLLNLVQSLFAEVQNTMYSSGVVAISPKTPFTLSEAERLTLTNSVDIRVSGFGPLFGPVFVLAVTILLCALPRLRRRNTDGFLFFVAMTVTCALLCLIVRESWWARYAPYVWIVAPLSFAVGAFANVDKQDDGDDSQISNGAIIKALCGACVALQLINVAIVGTLSVQGAMRWSEQASRDLGSLEGEVLVNFGPFCGVSFNLADLGIEFEPAELDGGTQVYGGKITYAPLRETNGGVS